MMQTSLWAPSQARIESTNLFRFQKQVGVANYRELHQWSVANP